MTTWKDGIKYEFCNMQTDFYEEMEVAFHSGTMEMPIADKIIAPYNNHINHYLLIEVNAAYVKHLICLGLMGANTNY